MLRIAYLTALALALTACGDFTVEQPKDEQDQAESDEADREGHVGETSEEADPATAEPAQADDDRHEDQDTAVELEPARFDPVQRDWFGAVRSAPAGYHLATRAELVALIDAGVVEALGGNRAELWTADEESDRIALFVDGDSARSASMDKTMIMESLYVVDGAEGAQ